MDSKRKDDKSRLIELKDQPGKRRDELIAEVAAMPAMTGASVAIEFDRSTFGDLSLTEAVALLKEKVSAVQGGDLREAEALLISQAVALNSIFTNLSRKAVNEQYLNHLDTFMRIALKAQSQCRATLETLAAIKNPPIVYARQANIAQQQQVNNGVAAPTRADAYAGNSDFRQNELLEVSHGERLDSAPTGATSARDPALAPVGKVHGAENA